MNRKTAAEIARTGDRYRWKRENEGFNRQKNGGLNPAHVDGFDPEKWKAYYVLLPIAFLPTRSLERGSLRFQTWEAKWIDPGRARKLRIQRDTSWNGTSERSLRVRRPLPLVDGSIRPRPAIPRG